MQRTVFVEELIKSGDPFAIEQPPTAVTGHPYLDQPSPLAVMNESGSGQIVRVRLSNLRPNTGPNALTSLVAIQKITALTPGTPTVPFKFDSTSADLPAEVLTGRDPGAYTITANSTIRRVMALTELNPTRALAWMVASNDGDSRMGFDSGEMIRLTGDADVTGHVLREGQGLALVFVTDSPSHCFTANCRFKNAATGATYRLNEIVEPRYMAGVAALYIFNGSGSGVVLEVEKIQVREIGTDELVVAEYQLIEGLYGGDVPNYVMSDTAQSLPTGITIRRNCVCNRMGSKAGALITMPSIRRVLLAEPPYGPGISGGPQISRRGVFSKDWEEINGEVILREGQGVGLFLRSAGSQLCHEATITIEVEDAYPTPAEIAAAVWTKTGRTLTA
jgi:hypothetical protein